MEYTVLKRGQLEGPFSQEEVRRMVQDGTFTPDDLAQTPVSYYWMPLHKLLAPESAAEIPAYRPYPFRVFSAEVTENVRRLFEHCPLETGVICLLIGCVVSVLGSVAPLLMYGPWLLAALIAGALLILHGRLAAGFLLCGGAILLPMGLVHLVQ